MCWAVSNNTAFTHRGYPPQVATLLHLRHAMKWNTLEGVRWETMKYIQIDVSIHMEMGVDVDIFP